MESEKGNVAVMPKVKIENQTFDVKTGTTILQALLDNGVEIHRDCQFGYCGTDPIMVLQGEENLSPPGEDEKFNLEFNKFPPKVRMACVSQIFGDIEIELFN